MTGSVPHHYVLSLVHLDRNAETPLYRQIYRDLREAILTRQLEPGVRLPSTRDLADVLDVSRNTVQNAYDQLVAEGYLEPRVGSGTYVTEQVPDDLLHVSGQQTRDTAPGQPAERTLSQRGAEFVQQLDEIRQMKLPLRSPENVFTTDIPDLAEFPFDLWQRLTARQYRQSSASFFTYHSPFGYEPLREALAGYLKAARGVRCEPEQIIVVSGSQEALFLAAHVLLDPGDAVWMEEPGYSGAKRAMRSAALRIVPAPVDSEGLDVDAGLARAPEARLAYVTPSHQFPLGYTMSLRRRLALLRWAEDTGGWILEDDYDSEYRYSGRPLASLQGLDTNGRVIYVGTFSKVLFPALRLGYVVVPPDLVAAFVTARGVIDLHPPIINQAVLADFIAEGHFTRHLRRMRKHYGQRNAVFVEEAARRLSGLLELGPTDAGMHITGRLPPSISDREVSRRAADHEVEARPLSDYYLEAPARGGFVLGYAAATKADIRTGIRRLAAALDDALGT